jgi:hypothetical protein
MWSEKLYFLLSGHAWQFLPWLGMLLMYVAMWLLWVEYVETGAEPLDIESGFFWVVTPCSLEGAFMFWRNHLPSASPRFLLGLLFDPEGEGDMFLWNISLPPNYMELQPRGLYSLEDVHI